MDERCGRHARIRNQPGARGQHDRRPGAPARDDFSAGSGMHYLGCMAHPLLWGEDAETCKSECFASKPSLEELLVACPETTPGSD
ncbi:MAG: hypothetical protein P8R42_15975 [Candidatus Binatia bacterium]|nr:hypothetical protein [Candidatus Binatia bacterium]